MKRTTRPRFAKPSSRLWAVSETMTRSRGWPRFRAEMTSSKRCERAPCSCSSAVQRVRPEPPLTRRSKPKSRSISWCGAAQVSRTYSQESSSRATAWRTCVAQALAPSRRRCLGPSHPSSTFAPRSASGSALRPSTDALARPLRRRWRGRSRAPKRCGCLQPTRLASCVTASSSCARASSDRSCGASPPRWLVPLRTSSTTRTKLLGSCASTPTNPVYSSRLFRVRSKTNALSTAKNPCPPRAIRPLRWPWRVSRIRRITMPFGIPFAAAAPSSSSVLVWLRARKCSGATSTRRRWPVLKPTRRRRASRRSNSA